jgi:hypothetical protein
VATTKKEPYVNRYFSKEIQEKGKQFIEEGKVFVGGFWQNRTRTSYLLGYGDWKSVPEEIQLYLNQVNRSAIKRGKKQKAEERKLQSNIHIKQIDLLPTDKPLTDDFLLSKGNLRDIYDEVVKIPSTSTPQQIRIIREYITRQSGFDPNRLLLSVTSRMEK